SRREAGGRPSIPPLLSLPSASILLQDPQRETSQPGSAARCDSFPDVSRARSPREAQDTRQTAPLPRRSPESSPEVHRLHCLDVVVANVRHGIWNLSCSETIDQPAGGVFDGMRRPEAKLTTDLVR